MDFSKFYKIGVKNIKKFDEGKRGVIFIGEYKKTKIVIKIKKGESKAINRIQNEGNFLRILNKYDIGPKVLIAKKDFLMYKFVKGEFILNFIKKNNKNKIKKIILNILDQCFIIDKLKINKLEMHKPLKHIIIDKNPVLIDFERSYFTEHPKNVTQFCQFLMCCKDVFKKKGLNINNNLVEILKKYKKNPSKNRFLSLRKAVFTK